MYDITATPSVSDRGQVVHVHMAAAEKSTPSVEVTASVAGVPNSPLLSRDDRLDRSTAIATGHRTWQPRVGDAWNGRSTRNGMWDGSDSRSHGTAGRGDRLVRRRSGGGAVGAAVAAAGGADADGAGGAGCPTWLLVGFKILVQMTERPTTKEQQ